MKIQIKNLHLRTVIGMYDWERKVKQDLHINITLEFDGSRVAQSDSIEHTVNYKSITKKVIALVEGSSFFMLEKLTSSILDAIMEDQSVEYAEVEVDKIGALRYSQSVSICDSRARA